MCGGRQFVLFFFQSFKEMMIFGGQLRRNKTVDFSFGEWNDIDMSAQREYLPQSNASYEHTISFSWIRVYANCYERSLLRAMHLYRPLFYSILFFFLLCSSPSPWHLCFPQTVSLCCHRVLMLAHRQQDDDDDDGAAGERQQAERDRESEWVGRVGNLLLLLFFMPIESISYHSHSHKELDNMK